MEDKTKIKTTPTASKNIKYVVNQKLNHFDDISFRELFGENRSGFFLQNKTCIY
jgi:TfoX/Sxy family transcriptional regulator of competence genes